MRLQGLFSPARPVRARGASSARAPLVLFAQRRWQFGHRIQAGDRAVFAALAAPAIEHHQAFRRRCATQARSTQLGEHRAPGQMRTGLRLYLHGSSLGSKQGRGQPILPRKLRAGHPGGSESGLRNFSAARGDEDSSTCTPFAQLLLRFAGNRSGCHPRLESTGDRFPPPRTCRRFFLHVSGVPDARLHGCRTGAAAPQASGYDAQPRAAVPDR